MRAWPANAAVLALAVGISVAISATERSTVVLETPGETSSTSDVQPVTLPDGSLALADAGGHLVPLRPYRRVVSTTLVTDHLLASLWEADRILAFSATGVRSSPVRHLYAGKLSVEGFGPLEAILAVHPDLVLLNTLGRSPHADQLRAAGVEVFDLGGLHGLASVLTMMERLGTLAGAPDRGRALARGLRRHMEAVARDIPPAKRRRALFLTTFGRNLFGGTVGAPAHDLLTYAGLVDVAATRYRAWTQYTAEQVLGMDPELLVTRDGQRGALCGFPGLQGLAPCRDPRAIVELPPALLDEPGLSLLETTERLRDAVYGPPTP